MRTHLLLGDEPRDGFDALETLGHEFDFARERVETAGEGLGSAIGEESTEAAHDGQSESAGQGGVERCGGEGTETEQTDESEETQNQ
jgi:hypothetical protein